jgi:hypothetical protein
MILRVQISYNVFTFLELKRKNNIQKEKEIRVEMIARYLKYLLSLLATPKIFMQSIKKILIKYHLLKVMITY